jgi:hypothetical protein
MIRRRKLVGIAVLGGALATVFLAAQLSSASHVRPKGASPFRSSMVPAFKQCIPPGNRQHGAPLVFASCSPPVQESNFLTIGSPDANGAGANSTGYVLLRVKSTSPEDVLIDSVGTDVRCKPGGPAAFCSNANAADGPDYSGGLQGNASIRISDHYNGTSLNEAATVQDIPFPVNGSCAATPTATNIGATCSTHTSANAVVSGSVKDTQRGVVEISQLQIKDGGSSGASGAPDATLFSVEGIFIP